MKKIIFTAILGLLLTCSGGYLRLHAKSFSMHSEGTVPAVDSNGNAVGSATWSREDASQTAALTDVALVLLYCGSALFVVAIGAWLFVPARKLEYEKSVG